MGRMYTVVFQLTAVTAQVDLFDLAPASNKPIALHEITLGQTTELTDASDEVLGLQIVRGLATVGSGGSSATPGKLDPAEAASGATCRVLDTTIAVVGGGSTDQLFADAWYIRGPYLKIWTPETRPKCTSTETRIVIRLTGAPADSVTTCGTVTFEELT